MLGHEAKIHARLLIHLVAARAFQIEQTCEQIRAGVQRNYPAHYAANFQIKEWRDQLFNQSRAWNVIRIENKDDLCVHQFHGVFQCRRLAAFASDAMKGLNAPRKILHKLINDLPRAVRGTVVHRYHQHPILGIFDRHQGVENVGDHLFLVVRGYQHGDGRPVCGVNVDVWVPLESEKPI